METKRIESIISSCNKIKESARSVLISGNNLVNISNQIIAESDKIVRNFITQNKKDCVRFTREVSLAMADKTAELWNDYSTYEIANILGVERCTVMCYARLRRLWHNKRDLLINKTRKNYGKD